MVDRYVYVLNEDKNASTSITHDFGDKGDAFPATAFSTCSTNPIIKATGISDEYAGESANFFEIRNGPFDGQISNESTTEVVNRFYPSGTSIATTATNKQQTLPNKIRTYKNTTGTLLQGSTGLSPSVNLETYDWFVLINPSLKDAEGIISIKSHFAKLTKLVSYDQYSDGFEFEPSYPTTIPRETTFELFKGPAVGATDVVAVSYGLRGDTTTTGKLSDKYDVSNVVSRPTWYFYEDRLINKSSLDNDTKYTLTTTRYLANGWIDTGETFTSQQRLQYVPNASLVCIGSTWLPGQSIYREDKTYLGNVKSFTSTNIFLDYARNTFSHPSTAEKIFTGRSTHQTVFRTQREYGKIINDFGRHNTDAILIDNTYDKDTINTDIDTSTTYTYDPSIWKNSIRNSNRNLYDRNKTHSSYSATSNNINTISANLTGAKRYLYYKSSHLKNDIVTGVINSNVNIARKAISNQAQITVLDPANINSKKWKIGHKLVVRNSIHQGTFGEYELPFTVSSSISGGNYYLTLNQITEGFDYKNDGYISVGDMIRVRDYYYVVSAVYDPVDLTQKIQVNYKKKLLDTAFSSVVSIDTIRKEKAYIRNWAGLLRAPVPIDTEVVYDDNDFKRLTINGNTITKKNNSLYNEKLVILEPHLSGLDIPIDYGDNVHQYVKLQNPLKEFYKEDPTVPFLYYTRGKFAIDEEVFSGIIDVAEKRTENYQNNYFISGRDTLGRLLDNTVVKNMNLTEDVIYSSLIPMLDINITDGVEFTTSGGASGKLVYLSGNQTSNLDKYDLLFTNAKRLIGEVVSSAHTSTPTSYTTVTLTDDIYTPVLTSSKVEVFKLRSDQSILSCTKAMQANIKASAYPTELSAAGSKGLIFHDGQEIIYADTTGIQSFNPLRYSSPTGNPPTDGSYGYDITDTKGISTGIDSEFAFKIGEESEVAITYSNKSIPSSPNYFAVLNTNTKRGEPTTLTLAPTFPVVLGSVELNSSDSRFDGNSYIYMVNRNIPTGGFLHTLQPTHTTYYGPDETFRYLDLQEINPGAIKETYTSIYNDAKTTQKITGAAPAYCIVSDGSVDNPSFTTNIKPREGSNLADTDYIKADTVFGTGSLNSAIIPTTFTDSTAQPSSLINIDSRTKRYDFMALGDIYPESKLRHNNLGFAANAFTDYGILLESDAQKGTVVNHTNYTGSTKESLRSEGNYQVVDIDTSTKTANETKRWGICRLVEATFDWHFNPVDAESVYGITKLPTLDNFKYSRFEKPTELSVNVKTSPTQEFYVRISGDAAFVAGDMIYKDSDGTAIAQILTNQASTSGNSWTITGSANIKVYNETLIVWTGVFKAKTKLWDMYADSGWGINDRLTTNSIRLPNVYIANNQIEKSYLHWSNLKGTNTSGNISYHYYPHNIWIPLLSQVSQYLPAPVVSGDDLNHYTNEERITYLDSPYHEANDWDNNVGSAPNTHFHVSRVISGLCMPTFTADGNNEANQYYVSKKAHIYDNCIALFRDYKLGIADSDHLLSKTSSPLELDIGGPHSYAPYTGQGSIGSGYHDYIDNFRANNYAGYEDEKIDQHAANLFITKYDIDTAIIGTRSKSTPFGLADYVKWEWVDESGSVSPVHGTDLLNADGQLYQAQMFIKPQIKMNAGDITFSNSNKTATFLLDDDTKHSWLSYVPSLVGYYLVSDDNEILRIITHGNSHSTFATHTLTFDTVPSLTMTYRLMRLSETTFDETPDYFEVNKLFDTGLQYDINPQNFRTGAESSVKSEYSEGVYAMYLLLDIDTMNTDTLKTIERRTVTAAGQEFDNGDTFECYITDGYFNTERPRTKTITVTKSLDGALTTKLKFEYEGVIRGVGVVSFGEAFTLTTNNEVITDPTRAYIGATVSVGTDVEKAIQEILSENNIDVDMSGRNQDFTGSIVASVLGTTITVDSGTNISDGDIIYNQDGKLIGKVESGGGSTSIVLATVDTDTNADIFYTPVANDELVRYSRKPYIDNTQFNSGTDRVLSAINFLASKRGLEYGT